MRQEISQHLPAKKGGQAPNRVGAKVSAHLRAREATARCVAPGNWFAWLLFPPKCHQSSQGFQKQQRRQPEQARLLLVKALGTKKPRLLGFLAGLLDRCVFGVTPPCLEHWLVDRKDFFLLLYDPGDLPRLFFCVSCTEDSVAGIFLPRQQSQSGCYCDVKGAVPRHSAVSATLSPCAQGLVVQSSSLACSLQEDPRD